MVYFNVKSLFIFIVLIGCSSHRKNAEIDQPQKSDPQLIYDSALENLHKKNFHASLEEFKQYIDSADIKKDWNKIFWSIDNVARIYLREKKSPKEALVFFDGLLQKFKFNEAEEDAILEWISVTKEWQKLGRMPNNIKNPNDLFRLGERFYQSGIEKIEHSADDSGNADFYIAATYLVPYVFNYDKGKNIGKALFMLGNIRFRSWNDYEYWTENYYLKEVIRRYPHSDLSWKAYNVLEEGIKMGYTGSSGDWTPPSQIKMLQQLKILAKPKK